MKKILFVGTISLLTVGQVNQPLPILANDIETVILAKKPQVKPQVKPQIKPQPQPVYSEKIEVINLGSEPRIPLRFTPVINTTEKVKMTFNMKMEMSLQGNSFPSPKMPNMIFTVESIVTKIENNGNIHFKVTFTDVEITPTEDVPKEVVETMQKQFKKVVGMGGTFVINNKGKYISGNFDLPKSFDSGMGDITGQLSQSLQQMSAIVPEESLGIGAKWTVTENFDSSLFNLKQTANYELVSLKDGIATVNVTIDQNADKQEFKLPGFSQKNNDFRLMLNSLKSTGKGNMEMSFYRLLPMSANISINTDMESQMTMNFKIPKQKGKPQKNENLEMLMNMKQTIDLTIKSD
ncbi:MAG TPA: DUF6263 family protein [Allocoleopsis sp.]